MKTVDRMELLRTALSAVDRAYVNDIRNANGAALLTDSGEIYVGCTVEAINQASSICACEAALANAISHGARDFLAIAIAGNGWDKNYMCGNCRQLYSEFSMELLVITENGPNRILYELLPNAFRFGPSVT